MAGSKNTREDLLSLAGYFAAKPNSLGKFPGVGFISLDFSEANKADL